MNKLANFTKKRSNYVPSPFLLIVILSIFSANLKAQTNQFSPGYYVSTNQDTIRGFIQDRTMANQANSFYFKSSLDQKKAQRFTPAEVIHYYYEPKFYFHSIPVVREGKEEVKFLQKLVDGYATLYQDNRVGDPIYILTKVSGESIQLEKNDSIVEDRIKVDRKYLGQMRYLFRDCPQFLRNSNRVYFTQSMLSRFVHQYNKCAHPDQKSQKLLVEHKPKLSIGGSIGYGNLNSVINGHNVITVNNKGKGSEFSVGLIASLTQFERISIKSGIVYHGFDLENQSEYSFGIDKFYHKISALEIPINMEYKFYNRKLYPYLCGGVRLPIFLKGQLDYQRIELDQLKIDENELLNNNAFFLFNLGAGIGLKVSNDLDLKINVGYTDRNLRFNSSKRIRTKSLMIGLEVLY